MTLQYQCSMEHQLMVPSPRVLFLLDPGHGGDSDAVKALKLKKYNIGTGTDSYDCRPAIPNLAQFRGYPAPPDGYTWRTYYELRNGPGYLHERHVVLDIAIHACQRLAEMIEQAGATRIMAVQSTRLTDSPVTLGARAQKYTNAVSPKLTRSGPQIGIQDVWDDPSKFQYVIFLSVHAEGNCVNERSGAFCLFGKDCLGRQPLLKDYLGAMTQSIEEAGCSVFEPAERDNVYVIKPEYVNVFTLLVEVDKFSSNVGYENLKTPEWRRGMGNACAKGMFKFARTLYGNHEYLQDSLLRESADLVARRIDDVLGEYEGECG